MYSNSITKFRKITQFRKYCTSPGHKVLFFGCDKVALESLKALYKEKTNSADFISRLEVVVSKKFHQCRKNDEEVPKFCEKNGIKTHIWSKQFSHDNNFDIGVVVSFGYFIPKNVINSFPKKMINMHGGRLPHYRGPAPIHYALLNNEKKTYVNIIDLHEEEFDKGNIFSETDIDIEPEETYSSLYKRVAQIGAQQVINVLKNFDEFNLKKRPQIKILDSDLIITKKLFSKDARVLWDNWNAELVYGRWRALPEKLYTNLGPFTVKLKKVSLPDFLVDAELKTILDQPGSIVYYKPKKAVLIGCKGGSFIMATQFQILGKPTNLSAADFAHAASLRSYHLTGMLRDGTNTVCTF